MKRKPVSREEFEEFKGWQGDINVDDAGAITELRRALAALTEQVEGLPEQVRSEVARQFHLDRAGNLVVPIISPDALDEALSENGGGDSPATQRASSPPSNRCPHCWEYRARVAEARVKELEGAVTRYLVVLERGDFADTDELERLVDFGRVV